MDGKAEERRLDRWNKCKSAKGRGRKWKALEVKVTENARQKSEERREKEWKGEEEDTGGGGAPRQARSQRA